MKESKIDRTPHTMTIRIPALDYVELEIAAQEDDRKPGAYVRRLINEAMVARRLDRLDLEMD